MARFYLPAELEDMVIRFYVNTYGVRDAWKIRAVCRRYKNFADDEIFARQPVSAFLRLKENSARVILKNMLGTHLAHLAHRLYRGKPCAPHDFLPKILKNRLDFLRRVGTMEDGQELAFALMLGNVLASACKSAWDLATCTPTSRAFEQILPRFDIVVGNEAVEDIVTAAAAGDLETIKAGAVLYGDEHLWNPSYAFGYPLSAAAGGNHMKVVEYLVAYFRDNYRKYPNEKYDVAFMKAIDVSLIRRKSTMTLLLLDVYHHYFPVVPKHHYDKWLAKAVMDSDKRIYIMLRSTLRHDPDVRHDITAFELACKSDSRSTVQWFFDNRILGINQGYLKGDLTIQNPVSTAVEAGKLAPVEQLLRLGAHPDGVPTCRPYDRPLWRAAVKNNLDIFRLLLKWGADRQAIIQQWDSTSNEFKCERFPIWLLLCLGVKNTPGYWDNLGRRTYIETAMSGRSV